MKLIVHELVTSLYQEVTTGSKPVQLYAIRPHIYRHLSPSGSLYLEVQDSSGNLIDTSETIAISSIGSGNYWHGYVRFLIATSLQASRSYRIALKQTGGYSFSQSAYVGWVNDFDLRKYSASYSPADGYSAPLDMEFWKQENLIRGLA